MLLKPDVDLIKVEYEEEEHNKKNQNTTTATNTIDSETGITGFGIFIINRKKR